MEPLTILAKYDYFQHLEETLIIGGVLFGVLFVITIIVDISHNRKKKRQRLERLKNKNKKTDIES